jgi:hypothetical protein
LTMFYRGVTYQPPSCIYHSDSILHIGYWYGRLPCPAVPAVHDTH